MQLASAIASAACYRNLLAQLAGVIRWRSFLQRRFIRFWLRRWLTRTSPLATWLGSADAHANQSVKATWLGSAQNICLSRIQTHLRLDRALLMRQKDANLHLAQKCGAGFQKAAQNLILSKAIRRMPRYLFIENNSTYLRLSRALLMGQSANLHLTNKCGASKKQLRILSKVIVYREQHGHI